MKRKLIIQGILRELDKAKKKHPNFPKDRIHQVAIMAEESGEAIQAAIDLIYDKGTIKNLETELLQTAAMCIRTLENMGNTSVNKLTKLEQEQVIEDLEISIKERQTAVKVIEGMRFFKFIRFFTINKINDDILLGQMLINDVREEG